MPTPRLSQRTREALGLAYALLNSLATLCGRWPKD